ncbi:MAG: signal peptidase I [Streptosporangiales bacterium]|nr:signal peptidase I [Streptosporangiales bacterium]
MSDDDRGLRRRPATAGEGSPQELNGETPPAPGGAAGWSPWGSDDPQGTTGRAWARTGGASPTEGDDVREAGFPGPGAGDAGKGDDGDPGGEESEEKPEKAGSFWRELPVLIAIALVLALVIKTWVVQAFFIPSQSMENTLLIGDRVLVNKLVYHVRDIKRGDVVVFNGLDSWDEETIAMPEATNPISRFLQSVASAFGVAPGEKDYIKRVIGLPGDKIACCDNRGRVTVNDVAIDEGSYLYPGDAPSANRFGPVTVQPGQLWVMGDHRSVSQDSREHMGDPGGGAIPESRVIGRAFVIVWPVNRMATLPIPETFAQPALSAAGAAAPALPLALGFAAAMPVNLGRRRLVRQVRARRRAR